MNKLSPEFFISSRREMIDELGRVISDYEMAALQQQGERVLYDYVKDANTILWDYQPTVLSPKKFFFPQEETLLTYAPDGKIHANIESKPLVLWGLRPCDLHALQILDEAFAEGHGDPHYLARREKAVIVGTDCDTLCDEHAFCYRVNAHEIEAGFDVMLYDIKPEIVLKVITEKGKAFVQKYFKAKATDAKAIDAFLKNKANTFKNKKAFAKLSELPEVFQQNKHHAVWKQEGDRCLSCGSCIMVCPTCYCFDVTDDWALNLKQGERRRRWDACMLSNFAEVAGGENFRKHATERLHHRISRKFDYLMKKHEQAVCVGCGRCVRACLADISPKTIVEEITNDQE